MSQILSNVLTNLVLWLLFKLAISQANNLPNELLPRHRGCNHSALQTNILKIQYHYQGEVKLVVLEEISDTTLMSPLVPVWNIEENGELSSEYKLYDDPSLRPTFYHGMNSFSAVTYFPSTRTLHGVIDQEFFIEHLPLDDAYNADLVDTFIKPIPDELANTINIRERRAVNNKRKSGEDANSSPRKRFRGNYGKKILYPEIFLIVDVLPSRVDRTLQNKFEKAFMYILSYWNAVDMLFRNLKRVDIRINIAGIIIGNRQNLEASGLVNAEHIQLSDPHVFLLKDQALDSLGTYFYHIDIIKRDSFDFLVWMTSAILTDTDVGDLGNEDLHYIEKDYTGAAVAANCGGTHYPETRNFKISNRAIVMYDEEYSQYHNIARGLAQLMFVSDDSVEVSHDKHHSNCLPSNPKSKSSGIMNPLNHRVEGYLLWSYCSEIHFQRYSRSKSSCCLLNYPSRTMGWPDPPHPVTPITQCECYGMEAQDRMNHMHNVCNQPLKCKNRKGLDRNVGMPLDGTPCISNEQELGGFCNHNECL